MTEVARAGSGAARTMVLMLVVVGWSTPSQTGPILEGTPVLPGPRISEPGEVDLWFSHHFQVLGPKVLNAPTFFLEVGLWKRLSASLLYSTNSGVGPRVNELEPRVTFSILPEAKSLALSAIGAWNSSARSADLALVAARTLGPVRLVASGRVFSDGYAVGGFTTAAALGASVELTRNLRIVGDAARVLWHEDAALGETPVAWSAGFAFRIPYTPHEMSLYATNVNTLTLQGGSRGTEAFRVGLQFLIPLHRLARFGEIFVPRAPREEPAPVAAAQEVVEVIIEDFVFSPETIRIRPGTTVRWINRDEVPHTATAESRAWDSGILQQGESWTHTFEAVGEVPYFCTLHPYMKASVIVEAQRGSNGG